MINAWIEDGDNRSSFRPIATELNLDCNFELQNDAGHGRYPPQPWKKKENVGLFLLDAIIFKHYWSQSSLEQVRKLGQLNNIQQQSHTSDRSHVHTWSTVVLSSKTRKRPKQIQGSMHSGFLFQITNPLRVVRFIHLSESSLRLFAHFVLFIKRFSSSELSLKTRIEMTLGMELLVIN